MDIWNQKIKTSYDKTKREIDWISKNKIEYVTDANSNFGILFENFANPAIIAAAIPPTPACKNTCVNESPLI